MKQAWAHQPSSRRLRWAHCESEASLGNRDPNTHTHALIHTHTSIHKGYTHIHTSLHTQYIHRLHTHSHMYTDTSIYIQVNTLTHIQTHKYINRYTYIHIHTQVYTHIHSHTYTHKYIHTPHQLLEVVKFYPCMLLVGLLNRITTSQNSLRVSWKIKCIVSRWPSHCIPLTFSRNMKHISIVCVYAHKPMAAVFAMVPNRRQHTIPLGNGQPVIPHSEALTRSRCELLQHGMRGCGWKACYPGRWQRWRQEDRGQPDMRRVCEYMSASHSICAESQDM